MVFISTLPPNTLLAKLEDGPFTPRHHRDLTCLGEEIDADGRLVHVIEGVVHEARYEGRFPDCAKETLVNNPRSSSCFTEVVVVGVEVVVVVIAYRSVRPKTPA